MKKVYETPEMINRMIATQNIADLSAGDDNEFSGDMDWN